MSVKLDLTHENNNTIAYRNGKSVCGIKGQSALNSHDGLCTICRHHSEHAHNRELVATSLKTTRHGSYCICNFNVIMASDKVHSEDRNDLQA